MMKRASVYTCGIPTWYRWHAVMNDVHVLMHSCELYIYTTEFEGDMLLSIE